MDTAKIYYDSEGNKKTIHQMVKCEPEWAADRIQIGKQAIDRLEKMKSLTKAVLRYETAHNAASRCPDMLLSNPSTSKAGELMDELALARAIMFGLVYHE